MTRKSMLALTVALGLSVQLGAVPGVQAQGADPVVNASSSITSVLATVIALPVKAVTCVTTVALGGVGYGLTAGSSEVVREELVGGLPYACGMTLYTTPSEVGRVVRDAEWQR